MHLNEYISCTTSDIAWTFWAPSSSCRDRRVLLIFDEASIFLKAFAISDCPLCGRTRCSFSDMLSLNPFTSSVAKAPDIMAMDRARKRIQRQHIRETASG